MCNWGTKVQDNSRDEDEGNLELSFTASDGGVVAPSDGDTEQPVRLDTDRSSPSYTETHITDDAVDSVNNWLDKDCLHSVRREVVIAYLDEILLLLLVVRGEACGKELLQDIRQLFNKDLSPGTVYPRLSALAEADLLGVTELSKRKIYDVSDQARVQKSVKSMTEQLRAFSLVLHELPTDSEAHQSQSQGSETNE
jgi:DNA-binding PadR family transcriptional regulator